MLSLSKIYTDLQKCFQTSGWLMSIRTICSDLQMTPKQFLLRVVLLEFWEFFWPHYLKIPVKENPWASLYKVKMKIKTDYI